ncbi:MAG: type VI secretion system tip protein VgrG [Desulfobulbaceae bacterium]|nr:type VI secretion system tip protein VgrG [Desulfobulbaceae bacterium]
MTSIGKKFSFASMAGTLATDTFDVVSFTGTEGLSKLYHFDVTLVSDNDAIDLESVIQSRAALTILRDDGNIVFNGVLSAFEQMETAQGLTQYRAVLTPAFWRQTLTYHNQIFLDKTIPQIIEAALQDGGLTSLDYELRLTGQYQSHEYICQYNESHLNFISRLMEREGIYYYFEQGAESEKLIITDTALLHSVMAEGKKVYYTQTSGLDETSREEVVKSLVCSQKMLPARVLLKDYNYRKPSLELSVEHVVSERGFGDVFIYGEHFSTPEEGAQLAKMRAEALTCRARLFQGESLIPYLRPGYLFQLVGHNRADFNDTYLTTDLTHHGDQTFLFTSGLGVAGSTRERSSSYRNSFTAISSSSQFRPERVTEKPRIPGTMNAHIDAAGSGQYAEIDDQGRYKVVLPFDLNSAKDGKASSWLRMAQPYAGENHGMHFPLHKGTEVLLTFIDGDPDRPIIAAAVPNPITPSPINSANATQSRITTAGGNKLHIEDQQGGERILLHTPKENSWIRMGTPNDPPPSPPGKKKSGIKAHTTGTFERESATSNSITMGEEMSIVLGSSYNVQVGTETSIMAGGTVDMSLGLMVEGFLGSHVEYSDGWCYTDSRENELVGRKSVEIKAGATSTKLNVLMGLMFALAALDTLAVGLVSQFDDKLAGDKEENKQEQQLFTGISDAAYAGVLLILDLILVFDKIGLKFPSEIKLDAYSTKVTSPYLQLETTGQLKVALDTATKNHTNLVSASAAAEEILKASEAMKTAQDALNNHANDGNIILKASLNIKNTANGTISNTAGLGISNEATAGGITNKAEAGGITNTADVANITNTAKEGNITNTAKLGISNETTGNITNKGDVNNLTATTSLNLTSNDAVSVKGVSIQMKATGVVGMEATTTLKISSKGVATIDGEVIKIA